MAQEMVVRRVLEFNLGRYEQMTIDVTLTGIPLDTRPETIAETFDAIMEPEIHRAKLATVHPEDDNVTSVYEWDRIAKEEC